MDHDAHAGHPTSDPPLGHGMIVWGDDTIWFSHLGMFMAAHGYQVLLKVKLPDGVMKRYREARQEHPGSPFYSLSPEPFVLTDLFPPAATTPPLTTIVGTLFREQFELLGDDEIKDHLVARDVTVTVTKVILKRKLVPFEKRPPQLRYVLFGTPEELYLAHVITRPPDFDQILAVESVGRPLTDADLAKGLVIEIPKVKDSAATRLHESSKTSGEFRIAGRKQTLQLVLGTEVYFSDRDFRR